MKLKSFEELEVWKRSREFTKLIYRISADSQFAKDWGLKDQIRRAVSSIMSNIAEGFDSGFKNEFIRFLMMARRSASEVQSQLYVAKDQEYIAQEEFQNAYKEAEEIRKMINGFIKYLRNLNS